MGSEVHLGLLLTLAALVGFASADCEVELILGTSPPITGRPSLDVSEPALQVVPALLEILNQPDNKSILNFQVVWSFVEFATVSLAAVGGAQLLSPGSPFGAPVRIVNTFDADVIPPGGNATLTFDANVLSPLEAIDLSLAWITFNGLACQACGGCGVPVPDSEAGCSPGLFSTCTQTFCCGVFAPPPPPPFPPSPAPPLTVRPPATTPETPASSPATPADPPASPGPSKPPETPVTEFNLKPDGRTPTLPVLLACAALVAAAIVCCAAIVWRRVCWHARTPPRPLKSKSSSLPDCGSHSSVGPPTLPDPEEPHPPVGLRPKHRKRPALAYNTMATQSDAYLSTGRGGDAGRRSSSGASIPIQLDVNLTADIHLEQRLGSGAMGAVYQATWRGTACAVKLLLAQDVSAGFSGGGEIYDDGEVAAFLEEISMMKRLRHPNIVELLGASIAPPHVCIIQELVAGGSLHDLLHGVKPHTTGRPLPYSRILSIGQDIAAAMVYLHPEIVHRDLKPQNVLIDSNGRALVADFGIAKLKPKTFLSTRNVQAGTPAYMAPELFEGSHINEKVDVFSMGVLLWECAARQVPWAHASSPVQIVYAVGVLQQRPPMPPMLPPGLATIIRACWEHHPNKRPTFQALRTMLSLEQAKINSHGSSGPATIHF